MTWSLLLLGLAAASPYIEGPPCPLEWIDSPRMLRILEVELTATATGARISLAGTSCAPEARALAVEVRRTSTSSTTSTSIDLSDVPQEARPRIAALAIAERTRGPGRSSGRPLAPIAEINRTPATSTRAAKRPPYALFASGHARLHTRAGTTLVGLRAGARIPLGPWISAIADATLDHATADASLGRITLDAYTAGLAFLFGRAGETFVGLGPRLEAGYVRTAGAPSDPTKIDGGSGSGPLVLASLQALAASAIVDRAGVTASVEVGFAIHGLDARADQKTAAGTGGPFAALTLGLELSL